MFAKNISIWVVFLEGIVSFLSPCILPLIPVYLGYLAGSSIEEISNNEKLRSTTIKNALGFVLGISFVYVSLGAGAGSLGKIFFEYNDIFRKIGGIIIIIFGLYNTGILKFKIFNYEKKFSLKMKSTKFINAFLLGITFSFGWTPCIGPILGSVLFMASNSKYITQAIFLLLIYSLGMAIPFLITTFLVGKFMRGYKKIYKYFNKIKIFGGVLLIIMGILIFLNKI